MYNVEDFKRPIIKMGTRVLRPNEYKALEMGCQKNDLRTMLQALLYTGMRYVEMQNFQKNPSCFDGDFIHLPKEVGTKKHKRTQQERWVRLNNQGKMAIQHFINIKHKLPAYQGWNVNLKCWAKRAGLDPMGISVKSTRKTWESWLMFYYPQYIPHIALSQGHTQLTSLQHYINSPFTETDKLGIKNYVEGWI